MANFAFFNSAWIITNDRIQTIWTTMFFDQCKLDGGFALKEAFFLRPHDRLLDSLYARSRIRAQPWLRTGRQAGRTVVGSDVSSSIRRDPLVSSRARRW